MFLSIHHITLITGINKIVVHCYKCIQRPTLRRYLITLQLCQEMHRSMNFLLGIQIAFDVNLVYASTFSMFYFILWNVETQSMSPLRSNWPSFSMDALHVFLSTTLVSAFRALMIQYQSMSFISIILHTLVAESPAILFKGTSNTFSLCSHAPLSIQHMFSYLIQQI